MKREQYIQYRITNDFYPIIYAYYLEKKIMSGTQSFHEFKTAFNIWLAEMSKAHAKLGRLVSPDHIIEDIITTVNSYYDGKFAIHYLIVKKEVKSETSETLIF